MHRKKGKKRNTMLFGHEGQLRPIQGPRFLVSSIEGAGQHACMQGKAVLRAVLPLQKTFPQSEMHSFNKGTLLGSFYPISKGKCVWSLIVPETNPRQAGGNASTSTAQHKATSNEVELTSGPADSGGHKTAHEVRPDSFKDSNKAEQTCVCCSTPGLQQVQFASADCSFRIAICAYKHALLTHGFTDSTCIQ